MTNGHLDLVNRSRRIFSEVVVAVATNIEKKGTFSLEERIAMLTEVLGSDPGVRIIAFDGLAVDFDNGGSYHETELTDKFFLDKAMVNLAPNSYANE